MARPSLYLDRVHADAPLYRGRALDLGCGRGVCTQKHAHRGWEAVGIDIVPTTIDSARRCDTPGTTFIVRGATRLESLELGTFDLFLDIDCLQGL